MRTKQEIVENWLPRYTGLKMEEFGEYILLTNFQYYVDEFAKMHGVEVIGRDKSMPNATAENITMINFGMGSPNAATIMDLLSAIMPGCFISREMWLNEKENRTGIIYSSYSCYKRRRGK